MVVIDFFFLFIYLFYFLSPLFAARQSGKALEAALQGLSIGSAARPPSLPAPGRCAGGQLSWVASINQ